MDESTKQRLIAKISWAYIPATINTKDDIFVSLLLRSPTPKQQAKAAIVYSNEYKKAIALGLLSEDDLIKDMISLDRWSLQKDAQIDGLYADIHKIRRGLLDYLFNRINLEKARTLLRRAEFALFERLSKRYSLTENSAESHALISQQRYLISKITEDENSNLFWKSDDDFEQFDDMGVITYLCQLFFKESRVDIKSVRELARSQQWRSYWEIAKNTNDLFDGPIVSWSLNQRELCYWSTIYDSVNSAYEKPSRDIIEDDDLLDSWFIRQGDKSEKSNTTPKSGKQVGEEFIMADKDGSKRVYAMNEPDARAKVKARQQVINKQGVIREQDMPDSQRDMRKKLAGMQRQHVKDIGRR